MATIYNYKASPFAINMSSVKSMGSILPAIKIDNDQIFRMSKMLMISGTIGKGRDMEPFTFTYKGNFDYSSEAKYLKSNIKHMTYGFIDGGMSFKNINLSFKDAGKMDRIMLKRNNKIIGSRYNDTLNGFNGDDVLIGGRGADKFIASKGKDIAKDFSLKHGDRIVIRGEFSINAEKNGITIDHKNGEMFIPKATQDEIADAIINK